MPSATPKTSESSLVQELRRRVANRRSAAAVLASYNGDEEESIYKHDTEKSSSISPLTVNSSLAPLLNSNICLDGRNTLLLPQLIHAKHESQAVQMDLFDMQAKHNVVLRFCDQQFTVEKNVRWLQSGINATQSNIRQRKEQLGDLESRVLRLSKTLNDASSEKTFAKTTISMQEEIRRQQISLMHCSHCRKEFLPNMLQSHQAHCIGKSPNSLVLDLPIATSSTISANQLLDQLDPGQLKSTQLKRPLPCFVSQPPRNLRVKEHGVTHNSILLAWDPPIFTGSTPILDYELWFSIGPAVGSHTIRSSDESPSMLPSPQLTSRWCLQTPVAPNEFRVMHLTAGQTYMNFTLCAITNNGKSLESNHIDRVELGPPVAPTKPLFLSTGAATAKTISLGWIAPFDDGGTPIAEYEIAFSEAVMQESSDLSNNSKKSFLDVSEVVYRSQRIRTHSSATTFTITGLLSGKEHKAFQVRAVNIAGIPGEYSDPIDSIFTIAPGNEFKLLDELQAAVNARTRIVDSQFLSGFMQRYERQHYIQLVSQFILTTHPNMERKVAAILGRITAEESIESTEEDKDEEVLTPAHPPKQRFDDLTPNEKLSERRRQFHFRIAELRSELKKAEYNVQWCKDRRIDIVALIRAAESRIVEKQAELERARMFTGPQMDSDVLENGLQRFRTKDLILALEDEIEIEQLYIIDMKADIIKTENYLRADEKRRATILKRLHERQEALEKFENDLRNGNIDIENQHFAQMASLARLRGGLLYRAFAAFVQNRLENMEVRRKMTAALVRCTNYRVRGAFKKWRTFVRFLQHNEAGGVDGVGSVKLLDAAIGRDDLIFQAQEMLQQLRQTDGQLKEIVWTVDQRRDRQGTEAHRLANATNLPPDDRQNKFSSFLVEADAKMDLHDFEGALRLYNLVLNNAKWIERIDFRQQIQLLLKVGDATLQLNKHEQALVLFNRVSLMASRLPSSRADQAKADMRIAQVHLAMRSLRSSIECYERALLSFEAVGDQEGQLQCYRGLQSLYTKMEDTERIAINKRLAGEIEFALSNKLHSASEQLAQLQQRLVGVGAESSCEVKLERVGSIVPRLRRNRIQQQFLIREELKLVASLEKLLFEKKALLAQGEEDLKRALASDSSQVDSSVINGANARYEIETFKKKLAKLMGSVKVGGEQISNEIANAKIRVSNAQDEIREFEQELLVETGELMRRMMAKEPLRCFQFNATNEALKNVIGTASHGISTCVAAAGLNGLLFDILTGACLAQAVGDPHKQHVGPPIGHQAQIICLYYIGNRIYTGSMDFSLGVWDVKDEQFGGFSCSLTKMLMDFDAVVMSVSADTQWIVCGCSDCDVFVFDAQSFVLIARIIAAHTRTVTAIAVQSFKSTLTTGSGDRKIKVWELGPVSPNTPRRPVKLICCLEAERRGDEFFNGHLHPISCLKQTASEIVSGDSDGQIIVWNLEAGEDQKLLRICDVHRNNAVTCLQFDATRIVSGASNGEIGVTDFATGHLLQTLHGREPSPVLDLQFDRTRMVSMSANGVVRLWFWERRMGVGSNCKKYHILSSGETLRSLSLKYRTSINKLLEWNRLPDSSKLYLGQKLIVEIDTDGSASDELKMLDMAFSVPYGKLSYENLDFIAANKIKNADVEKQWAARKQAMLAKEYFPPLNDDDDNVTPIAGTNDDDGDEDEEDDSDSDMPMESEASNSHHEDDEDKVKENDGVS